MFIDDKQFKKLEKDLRSVLLHIREAKEKGTKSKVNILGPQEFAEHFSKDKEFSEEFIHKLCNSTYSDSIERGSASVPLYNGNWSIGMFGSVWVDLEVKGVKMRISLTEDKGQKFFEIHIINVEE